MKQRWEAIVVGCSSGGVNALIRLLGALPEDFLLPVIIVQHVHAKDNGRLAEIFSDYCPLPVKEAEDKETIAKGHVYIAPPNYHLLVERHREFALSFDEPVLYSRPSIDVLFDSASVAYKNRLIGILLTGANHDGSLGMSRIQHYGGLTIVQNPQTAEMPTMPQAAINSVQVDHILDLEQIPPLLLQLAGVTLG